LHPEIFSDNILKKNKKKKEKPENVNLQTYNKLRKKISDYTANLISFLMIRKEILF